MRFYEPRALMRAAWLAAALTIAGFSVPHVLGAQELGEPETVQQPEPADDGQDWGWLGLLGLAGLLGLRRRDRTRVDATKSRL